MADPIIVVRDFTGHLMNQITVDPDSKKEVITHDALILIKEAPDGTVCTQAESISLLRLEDIPHHWKHLHMQRFFEELKSRRVKRVYGWVQPAFGKHLEEEYGLHLGGEERPSQFGPLVLVERWLP